MNAVVDACVCVSICRSVRHVYMYACLYVNMFILLVQTYLCFCMYVDACKLSATRHDSRSSNIKGMTCMLECIHVHSFLAQVLGSLRMS